MPTVAKPVHSPSAALKAMAEGETITLTKIEPAGALQARNGKKGIVFFWRYSQGTASQRLLIGPYDPTPGHVNKHTPTAAGYSIAAAIKAAEALAVQHTTAKAAGGGMGEILEQQKQAKAEAKAQQKAAAAAAKAGEVTFGEAWAEYLKERQPHWGERHYTDHLSMTKAGGETAKRGTRGRGVTIAGPLHEFLPLRLRDITPERITQWAKHHAGERPTVARLALRIVKAFINWCAENPTYAQAITGNPAKAKKAREALGTAGVKTDALLREQLPVWFAAVQGLPNRAHAAYLQTMLLTGARPGEVLEMQWQDINTQWKGLTIRDKVEGERVIPLTPYVASIINALPRRGPYVFTGTDDEQAMSKPHKALERVCSVAGITVTLHGLRRSFKSLTEWLEVPVGVVAQIQGHKPSATAEKHYTVRPLDLLRLHHERIEAWILEQAGVPMPTPQESGQALQLVKTA
ncbi:tyrosine-type recombinase/integrase [Acidovorax sp. NCPPB 2350]|nr:tyrosine-type recombinase/integrase [Acidovorax sp. NCPPB 2350]